MSIAIQFAYMFVLFLGLSLCPGGAIFSPSTSRRRRCTSGSCSSRSSSPIDTFLQIALNVRSRANEFEADRYSVETYQKPEALVAALKTLSKENLANLTPHPFYVFLNYSHPPMLARVAAIRATPAGSACTLGCGRPIRSALGAFCARPLAPLTPTPGRTRRRSRRPSSSWPSPSARPAAPARRRRGGGASPPAMSASRFASKSRLTAASAALRSFSKASSAAVSCGERGGGSSAIDPARDEMFELRSEAKGPGGAAPSAIRVSGPPRGDIIEPGVAADTFDAGEPRGRLGGAVAAGHADGRRDARAHPDHLLVDARDGRREEVGVLAPLLDPPRDVVVPREHLRQPERLARLEAPHDLEQRHVRLEHGEELAERRVAEARALLVEQVERRQVAVRRDRLRELLRAAVLDRVALEVERLQPELAESPLASARRRRRRCCTPTG